MAGKSMPWMLTGALIAAGPTIAAPEPPSPSIPPVIQIGAAYIAKQYCSCVFVIGRSQISCHAEFKPTIDSFQVALDRTGMPRRGKVSTRAGAAEGEAIYDRRYGCVVSK